MPTLTQVRNAANTILTDRLPALIARQENFRANRGRYWQGRPTHSVRPSHTNGSDGSAISDRLDETATNSFDTWRTALPILASLLLPCSLEMHAYSGPLGDGWALVLEFVHSGARYQKVVNVGPESYRDHDWVEVSPGPI